MMKTVGVTSCGNGDCLQAAHQAREVVVRAEHFGPIDRNDIIDAIAEDEAAVEHRHGGFRHRHLFAVEINDLVVQRMSPENASEIAATFERC
jgi:hypothetical protein